MTDFPLPAAIPAAGWHPVAKEGRKPSALQIPDGSVEEFDSGLRFLDRRSFLVVRGAASAGRQP